MEKMVCASCPEQYHDEMVRLCVKLEITKAFGKSGDMINKLDGKEWIPKWQARVVQAVSQAAATPGVKRVKIICIKGGFYCDAELRHQPKLDKAIAEELRTLGIGVTTRLEWLEFSDFQEEYNPTKINPEVKKTEASNDNAGIASMSVKEIKAAIELRGLGHMMQGLSEKHELVSLLGSVLEKEKINKSDDPVLNKPKSDKNLEYNPTKINPEVKKTEASNDNTGIASMSVKEIKAAIELRGLGHMMQGLSEKHELVSLLGSVLEKEKINKSDDPVLNKPKLNKDPAPKKAGTEKKSTTDTQKTIPNQTHSTTTPLSSAIVCDECDRQFKNIEAFEQHQKATGHITCNICGKGFSSTSKLIQHSTSTGHAFEDPVICDECDRQFKNVEAFEQHQEATGHITCNTCGKCFSSTSKLIQHGTSTGHAFEEPIVCDDCNRQFKNVEAFEQHQEATGHITCNICGKGFTSKNKLIQHGNSTGHAFNNFDFWHGKHRK